MRVALEKVWKVVILALKAPPLVRKINVMILQNRPMSDKHLQGVTIRLSYIGQAVRSLWFLECLQGR